MKIAYYWNKILKKARGKAILNSCIDSTSKIEAGSQIINSKMGKHSFCGYDCKIINCAIGAFCSIADGVIIGGASHPMSWASTSPTFYNGRDSVKKKFAEFERPIDAATSIGNDVWIGDRAVIKSGVEIGDGAVIGMGSVVTKNVGSYEIWAGNPARLIRKRFPDDVIEMLAVTKWWEKDDEEISRCSSTVKNPFEFARCFLEEK